MFIKNKYIAAVLRNDKTDLICFTAECYVEFEKAQNKTALYELISNRHKIINQCGLELVKDSLDQIEDQMNMYTMQLITDVSQEYFSKKNEKKNKSV